MNYTFFNISTSHSIGDSLSTVNLNYDNLDNWVTSIQLSAQNFWKPLVNFYQVKGKLFKSAAAVGTLWKPSWDNCVTQITVNSSKWLEPTIIFYPTVLTSTDLLPNQNINTNTQTKITTWLNTNFASTSKGSTPLYIQNQKAYVYILKQESATPINTVRLLQDTGSCSTNDVTVTTYCTNKYSGYVYCSNGDFNCDGQSNGCNQSATCPCRYPQTNAYTYNPIIQAYLNFNYTNTYESSNIECLVFEMQNCSWIYTTQL
jgi:hypothetical protein